MAQALFISIADIKKHTSVNGSVDPDKIINFVKIAQDIEIQALLGTDLYNKINDDIVAGTITDPYLSLVNDYIKPALIHYAMVHYLPFGSVTIANKGIYKHNAENSQTAAKSDIDYLVNKELSIAQHYAQRYKDFMCNNSTLFPEYNTNSNGDMHPEKNISFSNWFL